MSTKKLSTDDQELSTLFTYTMSKALKFKKHSESKAKDDSNLDAEFKKKLKNIDISADYDSG